MAKRTREAPLYAALSALRPADWSEAQWAREAGVSSSFFQDVKKGSVPRVDTLEAVLGAVGMTLADFRAMDASKPMSMGLATSGPSFDSMPNRVASPRDNFTPPLFTRLARDIPVLGTAEGADVQVRDDGHFVGVEATILTQGATIDWFRRPAALERRNGIYGLYIVGTSMEPRFSPGDPIIADAKRPPSIGDDVVVQLIAGDDEGSDGDWHIGLVKTLVGRSQGFVELEQYNPRLRFRLETSRTLAVHRIVPPREWLTT